MRVIVLFFLVSGMLSACGKSENDNRLENSESTTHLQILSTIKPIHSIVKIIAGESAQTSLLIPEYASPHDYSYKPSDLRKVKNANVVFRIDEHMEVMLNALLENQDTGDSNKQVISLAEASGITLFEQGHYHHNGEKGEEINNDHHVNADFHIWTSPKNAQVIAKEITKTLVKLDSKNKLSYQNNLQQFIGALEKSTDDINKQLIDLKAKPYIVFHNSWQYFANDFGLQKPLVVNLHEGLSSGAKTLSGLKEKIIEDQIGCVFVDASVSQSQRQLFKKNPSIKTVEVDALVKNIKGKETSYIDWLSKFANQKGFY